MGIGLEIGKTIFIFSGVLKSICSYCLGRFFSCVSSDVSKYMTRPKWPILLNDDFDKFGSSYYSDYFKRYSKYVELKRHLYLQTKLEKESSDFFFKLLSYHPEIDSIYIILRKLFLTFYYLFNKINKISNLITHSFDLAILCSRWSPYSLRF